MRLQTVTWVLLCLVAATPASAQVDLSGTWSVRMHEDWMERWPGPDPGDFTGLPLNADGRAWAESYSPSQLSMPERQCLYYPQTYRVVGPFAPRIWPESAPGAGSLKVVTTNLRPGYLRKNGVPYSGDTVLTEYWDAFVAPDDARWLVITTVVRDPRNLQTDWITSLHFRREADGSKWKPSSCSAEW